MGDPLYHAPAGATKTMRVTIVTLVFLLLAAVASAQDCDAQVELIADGNLARGDGWETRCVGHRPTLLNEPDDAYAGLGGNWHYRWKNGPAVCVYTTADRARQDSIGGGRLLSYGNSNRDQPRGGTYWVAEVDAGYFTWGVIGTCLQNIVPSCTGRCGDYERPGDGVF